jgi:hypothetical protein
MPTARVEKPDGLENIDSQIVETSYLALHAVRRLNMSS